VDQPWYTGRGSVDISYNQDSAISPIVNVCITPTTNGNGGGDCNDVLFAASGQGSRLIVPVTLVSPIGDLTPQIPVTYYLTARISHALSEVTATANGGLSAIFGIGICPEM